MKTFTLIRLEDVTGISGTGIVAQGVEFDSGRCVMEWLTAFKSIGVYQNSNELIQIHGHDGKTVMQYDDGPFDENGRSAK